MQPDDDKTQAVTVLSKGTVIGHYRIVEKIGAGGMGEVYLAEDTELNRKVALKFLSSHLCQDADCRARFKREAQAAAKLNHPNIVTIYEVSESNSRPFFAMEHVEGQTLKEVLSGKPLALNRILEIGIQVCEGLQAAHEKGIIHRDLKPANLMLTRHGHAIDLRICNATLRVKKGAIRSVGCNCEGVPGWQPDGRFRQPIHPSAQLVYQAGHWRAGSLDGSIHLRRDSIQGHRMERAPGKDDGYEGGVPGPDRRGVSFRCPTAR